MEAVGITPFEHLAASLAVATLCVQLWSRGSVRDARALRLVGLMAALPIVLWPLPAPLNDFIAGKEGALEAITAGVLGGLLVQAWRVRQPWVGLGAFALLLEEIDYGQWLSRVVTPDWLAAAGSHTGNLNTHNLPGLEAVWRLGPLLLCGALALRARWPSTADGWATSARLPRLDPAFVPGAAILLTAAGCSALLISGDQADEAAELAAVCLVALCWRADQS